MVCNQNVPDPNQHEQTLDVVRERPWHLSDSWEHIVDRRERRRHLHTRTDADTHTHMCTRTDIWHSRGGGTPPRVRQPGKGETVGAGQKREREGGMVRVFPHIQ